MFISFLKILCTTGLVVVLVVFITSREITFTSSQKAILKKSSSQEIMPLPSRVNLPVTTSTPLVETPKSTQTASVQPVKTTLKQIAVPSTKIADLAKKSIYVPMNVGSLDTDASYRPSISPCKVAMGYKIGIFDTNFGISKETFINEIQQASALWDKQIGKTLFTYNPNGPLIINLVYDERQARTDEVNNLVLEIENAKANALTIKNAYETEKNIYLGDGEQYTKDTEAFTIRYDAYKAKVAMYNSQGGAPADAYNQLNQELSSLRQDSTNLESRRVNLNSFVESINTKVNRYNELVAYINGLIAKSNAAGGSSFTEGRFTPRTNTIDIYQFNDMNKLRRVLTHELGHVLGINHNENVYSIMFSSNSATTTVLSDEDIKALFEVCPKN